MRSFTLPGRTGGINVIAHKRSIGVRASVVTAFEDVPRITDHNFDWDNYLTLSRSER